MAYRPHDTDVRVTGSAEFSPVPSDMELHRPSFNSAGRMFCQSEGLLLTPLLLISRSTGFAFSPWWIIWHVFLQPYFLQVEFGELLWSLRFFPIFQSFCSYPSPEATAFLCCREEASLKSTLIPPK